MSPDDRNALREKYEQFLPAPNASMIVALIDENERMEREVAKAKRLFGQIAKILEEI